MTTPRTGVSVLAFSLLVLPVSSGFAQSVPAGTAKNAVGVLVVVRTDGVETRLRGRGALRVFEGDVLRMDGKGKALIETDEGIQVALNGDSVVQILSRWEKARGVTRVLRVQRGEVWARIGDERRALEIETPVGDQPEQPELVDRDARRRSGRSGGGGERPTRIGQRNGRDGRHRHRRVLHSLRHL